MSPHSQFTSLKDELRYRYANASFATNLVLEKRRLSLLLLCLKLRRPIADLRLTGVRGLPQHQALQLIQNSETMATLMAIQNKRTEIKKLEERLEDIRSRTASHPQLNRDSKLLHIHWKKMDNKISFLKKSDPIKFTEWRPKSLISNDISDYAQKLLEKRRRRRLKTSRTKLRKKERAINTRAAQALEKNLVINLTNIEVPPSAIAVLSYGPGFIPSPAFDDL